MVPKRSGKSHPEGWLQHGLLGPPHNCGSVNLGWDLGVGIYIKVPSNGDSDGAPGEHTLRTNGDMQVHGFISTTGALNSSRS